MLDIVLLLFVDAVIKRVPNRIFDFELVGNGIDQPFSEQIL